MNAPHTIGKDGVRDPTSHISHHISAPRSALNFDVRISYFFNIGHNVLEKRTMRITTEMSAGEIMDVLRETDGYYLCNNERDVSQSDFKNRCFFTLYTLVRT